MGLFLQVDDTVIIDDPPHEHTTILNAANNYSFTCNGRLISMLKIRSYTACLNTKDETLIYIFLKTGQTIAAPVTPQTDFLLRNGFIWHWTIHKKRNIFTPSDSRCQITVGDCRYNVNYRDGTFVSTTIKEDLPQHHFKVIPDFTRKPLYIKSLESGHDGTVIVTVLTSPNRTTQFRIKTVLINPAFALLKLTLPNADAFKYYNQPPTPTLFSLAASKIKHHTYTYTYNKQQGRFSIKPNECEACHKSIINSFTGENQTRSCTHIIPRFTDDLTNILTQISTAPENQPVRINGKPYKYSVNPKREPKVKMMIFE